jgi:hypothetical protein
VTRPPMVGRSPATHTKTKVVYGMQNNNDDEHSSGFDVVVKEAHVGRPAQRVNVLDS